MNVRSNEIVFASKMTPFTIEINARKERSLLTAVVEVGAAGAKANEKSIDGQGSRFSG